MNDNATVLYVVNSIGWSGVGFLLGWIVASMRRDVTVIKETVVDEEPPPPQGHTLETTGERATRVLGVAMIALAIITVVQGHLASSRLADVTDCQAEYNNQFSKVMTLRVDLADQDRKALQNMLVQLYRQRGSEQARLKTFQRWVRTVERTERQRQLNPLPETPEGDCR